MNVFVFLKTTVSVLLICLGWPKSLMQLEDPIQSNPAWIPSSLLFLFSALQLSVTPLLPLLFLECESVCLRGYVLPFSVLFWFLSLKSLIRLDFLKVASSNYFVSSIPCFFHTLQPAMLLPSEHLLLLCWLHEARTLTYLMLYHWNIACIVV